MNDETPRWLDDPAHVTWIVRGLYAACALLVVAGLFLVDHTHFSWETWPGFYGVYGFLAFTFAVLAGKQLRKVLMRDEGYYDE